MKTIKKLWKTIENLISFQSNPTGKVVNLSKKTFTREIFQLLSKNLNFVLTPQVNNQHRLKEEM